MTLSNREKILLIILAFIIPVGAFLYFLIFPMTDNIKENALVLEREQMILENLKQANQSGGLTELDKKVQREMERIEKILPTQIRLPEIYRAILTIGEDSGIKQENITMQDIKREESLNSEATSPQQPKETLLIIPIHHSFKGSYEQIEEYMDQIQQSERKIDIIEYELLTNNNEDGDISANFLLHSYGLVKEGQNLSAFVDYDFLKDYYGRSNPFIAGSNTPHVQEEED